jgi:hypothetical protein
MSFSQERHINNKVQWLKDHAALCHENNMTIPIKVRFHCSRTLSKDRVTRQVTEHVICSLLKSMSMSSIGMVGVGNSVGDLIICACASFVCQILHVTS